MTPGCCNLTESPNLSVFSPIASNKRKGSHKTQYRWLTATINYYEIKGGSLEGTFNMADSSSARPKCRQDVLNLVHGRRAVRLLLPQ